MGRLQILVWEQGNKRKIHSGHIYAVIQAVTETEEVISARGERSGDENAQEMRMFDSVIKV